MRIPSISNPNGSPQCFGFRTLFLMAGLAAWLAFSPPYLQAQSPLTIQPSTGNVGIGTTSPVGKFEVQSTGSLGTPPALSNAFISLTDGTSGLYFDPNQIVSNETNLNLQARGTAASANIIWFWTRDTLRALFDDSGFNISTPVFMNGGSVGIGTTAPAGILHVKNSQGYSYFDRTDTTGSTYLNFVEGGAQRGGIGQHGSSATGFANYVDLFSDGRAVGDKAGFRLRTFTNTYGILDVLTIINSGNVGIGTTSPTSKLHVVATLTATSKNFQIDHPLEPEKKLLVHSALEGPEVAVYYRGEAQLVNGETTILLPDYFETLTRKENRTVQLTPIDGWARL